MRHLISAATLLLALTACGGGGDESSPEPTPSPAASSESTSSAATLEPAPAPSTVEVPEVTLPEACERISEVIGAAGNPPSVDGMQAVVQEIIAISGEGDGGTRQDIELLRPGTLSLYQALQDGTDTFDAQGEYIDGINDFAAECAATGSDALQ